MRNWVKYLLVSLSLIILVTSNIYHESSTESFNIFSSKTHLNNKSENKNLILSKEQATNSDEILVELDEEDFSNSDHYTNFSFENNFYYTDYKDSYTFLWCKIVFKSIKLGILKNKLFILIRNIRI